jgi:hypothetical protein
MGILELTPSIRADTEAFNKALNELGWSKQQYVNKIKRAGISFNDKTSTKNFLNSALKKAGSSFRYKNILQSPTKIATEVGMGGVEPGSRGAPNNAKIWSDGTKIQKTAIKKFPNSVTKQRKYFVDTMKKIYGSIPKKKILNLFKNTLKGIKMGSPMGLMSELAMDMMEQNPELLSVLPGNQNTKTQFYNKGGMMDINQMTRPIGMFLGGDPVQERKDMMQQFMNRKEAQRLEDMNTGDPEKQRDSTYGMMNIDEITQLAINIAQQQGDSSEENIRKIIIQLRETLPSLQQDMADERRSPIASGINTLIDKLGLNRRTNLDRNVSASRTR